MSGWRTPVPLVLCDGAPLVGVVSASVTANRHFAADSFSFRVAMAADPAGLGAWDSRVGSVFEIRIGMDGGWSSLITGQADTIDVDPIAGLIMVEGRDFTARFLSARPSLTYANQTASDVAAALAAEQGLAAAITPTTTPIGRYYGEEHDRVLLDRYTRAGTEWDLLVWLADSEGFDVYVSGNTLYFTPPVVNPLPVMTWLAPNGAQSTSNVTTLHLARALTLAGPMQVTVKSWNSQLQTAISGSASTNPSSGLSTGAGVAAPAATYQFMRPNLTAGEASALAQRKLSALARHQYVVHATLPGELALAPGSPVAVTGTGSAFDQIYLIDEIRRTLDSTHGFLEYATAHAAES